MADNERHGGVKTALGDNYLLGKQEYPQNLLAAKRLLADFKGAPSKTRKTAEAADEQGVAFAEGGKGAEYVPTCHDTAAAGSARAGGRNACTSPRSIGPKWSRSTQQGTSAAILGGLQLHIQFRWIQIFILFYFYSFIIVFEDKLSAVLIS